MTKIEIISKAAEQKFGQVICILWTDEAKHADFFFVAIKRDNPVFEDAPFMTITASITPKMEANFFWGHYDLTAKQLAKAVAEGKLNAIAA